MTNYHDVITEVFRQCGLEVLEKRSIFFSALVDISQGEFKRENKLFQKNLSDKMLKDFHDAVQQGPAALPNARTALLYRLKEDEGLSDETAEMISKCLITAVLCHTGASLSVKQKSTSTSTRQPAQKPSGPTPSNPVQAPVTKPAPKTTPARPTSPQKPVSGKYSPMQIQRDLLNSIYRYDAETVLVSARTINSHIDKIADIEHLTISQLRTLLSVLQSRPQPTANTSSAGKYSPAQIKQDLIDQIYCYSDRDILKSAINVKSNIARVAYVENLPIVILKSLLSDLQRYRSRMDRQGLLQAIDQYASLYSQPTIKRHLGARVDTRQLDEAVLRELLYKLRKADTMRT